MCRTATIIQIHSSRLFSATRFQCKVEQSQCANPSNHLEYSWQVSWSRFCVLFQASSGVLLFLPTESMFFYFMSTQLYELHPKPFQCWCLKVSQINCSCAVSICDLSPTADQFEKLTPPINVLVFNLSSYCAVSFREWLIKPNCSAEIHKVRQVKQQSGLLYAFKGGGRDEHCSFMIKTHSSLWCMFTYLSVEACRYNFWRCECVCVCLLTFKWQAEDGGDIQVTIHYDCLWASLLLWVLRLNGG